jgi:hypothetical protein
MRQAQLACDLRVWLGTERQPGCRQWSPTNDGPNVTKLGTLGIQDLEAVITVEGATDAEVFRTCGKRV